MPRRRLLIGASLVLLLWIASTEALTDAQLSTLKTDITVTHAADFAEALAANNYTAIAAYYNTVTASTVWRPSVPVSELNAVIVGSVFNALTSGKQNGWFALTQGGIVDATSQTMRNWFIDIFGAGATLTALTQVGQRAATNGEILFSTAVQGSHVTTIFGVKITDVDVALALRLP